MEAASCDDWLVAGFMIPNKIIFTAAIKKPTPYSRSCGIFYVEKKTALLTASQDKSFMLGQLVLVYRLGLGGYA